MRTKILSYLLIGALSSQLFSCGYFLYKDRRGQKTTANLDWPIVGLDAIGLIFFIIPGVIAFAVDFSSGTIYLPATKQSFPDSVKDLQKDLQKRTEIKIEGELNKEKIAAAIKANTDIAVNLDDPKLQVYKSEF